MGLPSFCIQYRYSTLRLWTVVYVECQTAMSKKLPLYYGDPTRAFTIIRTDEGCGFAVVVSVSLRFLEVDTSLLFVLV